MRVFSRGVSWSLSFASIIWNAYLMDGLIMVDKVILNIWVVKKFFKIPLKSLIMLNHIYTSPRIYIYVVYVWYVCDLISNK